MNVKFTPKELYELRNFIPINDLIRELKLPFKFSEGCFRFLCPLCNEFRTSTKADTNLARCFRCEKNFNTIDLTLICRRLPFVEGVTFLKAFYKDLQKKEQRTAHLARLIETSTKALQ